MERRSDIGSQRLFAKQLRLNLGVGSIPILSVLLSLTMTKEVVLVGASNSVGLDKYATCIEKVVARRSWTTQNQFEAIKPVIENGEVKVLVINPDGNGADVETHARYVQEMLDLAKKHDVKTVLLPIGPREHTDKENPITRRFNAAHKSRLFRNVDAYVDFRAVLQNYIMDRHWLIPGKKKVAELICKAVRSLL